MKRVCLSSVVLFVAFVLFLGSCSSSANVTASPSAREITYQTFYDELSPYGTWINYPVYGEVWNPNMGVSFRPYASNGRWLYTNEGWAWNSYYSWGWAPFHYGRWLYDDLYGWLWVPGYEWSPAWVTWGTYNNFYCWAPLMPGININVGMNWNPHSIYWNVVNREHIYEDHIHGYLQNTTVVNNFSKNITIINNYGSTKNTNINYSRGPQIAEVRNFVHNDIKVVNIKEVTKKEIINNNTHIVNNSTVINNNIVNNKKEINNNIHYNNSVNNNVVNKNEVIENHSRNTNEVNNNIVTKGEADRVGKNVQNNTAESKSNVSIKSNKSNKAVKNSSEDSNVMKVYRPAVKKPVVEEISKPRPANIKKIENNAVRPISSSQEQVKGPRAEQIQNVRALPVTKNGKVEKNKRK